MSNVSGSSSVCFSNGGNSSELDVIPAKQHGECAQIVHIATQIRVKMDLIHDWQLSFYSVSHIPCLFSCKADQLQRLFEKSRIGAVMLDLQGSFDDPTPPFAKFLLCPACCCRLRGDCPVF